MQTDTPNRLSFSDTKVAFAGKSDARITKTWLLFAAMNNQFLMKTGTGLLSKALEWGLPVSGIVKYTAFEQFCGGEDIEECSKTIAELGKYGVGTILDYSVEGEKNEAGYTKTADEIIATINKAKGNKNIPFSVFKVTGVANFDMLANKQSGKPLSSADEQAFQNAYNLVDKICKHAYDSNVRIFIDAEESWIQDTIDWLAIDMMKKYNRNSCIVFNTWQMYRHESLANLSKALDDAAGQYWVGAKLVRGAYMEKERKRAGELNYQDPIQPDLQSTHNDYNAAIRLCLDHIDRVAFCAGTHNEESCYLLTEEMAKRGLANNDERIWFSQLLGMSDNISFNLANSGYNVAKYVPYGPVKSVMPYLVRRASENSSIAGQSSREFKLISSERARRKSAK